MKVVHERRSMVTVYTYLGVVAHKSSVNRWFLDIVAMGTTGETILLLRHKIIYTTKFLICKYIAINVCKSSVRWAVHHNLILFLSCSRGRAVAYSWQLFWALRFYLVYILNHNLFQDIFVLSAFGTSQHMYNGIGFCNKIVTWHHCNKQEMAVHSPPSFHLFLYFLAYALN
jgi:hypothetical protein